MNNEKKLVVKGIFWTGFQMVVNQGFAFIIRLVLARLLFPEQFGLVGMATVFTGFVQVLNDLGIGAALVQKKEQQLTAAHYHTAFWTGIVWSTALYLIISFGVAPLAVLFYDEPLLRSLIPVISLGILSSPINLVNKAQLTKKMNFKKIAFVDNTSNIISGSIALGLALWGAGVWSLAFNSVASILVAIPLYFRATGWLPKFIWDRKAFKDIFGFGVYTTGTNVANYLINNIDYLLIGKLLSAGALGAYTFAFGLTDTFRSRLMAVINNVMYPMYGKKQNEPVALKNYYLKVVNYNSLIIYPIMLAFFTFSRPIIENFFGDKWEASIIPLKIMAVAVMFHMMVNSNTALIRGMGRPDLEMKLQLFKSSIFVPMLVAGIHFYGILGASCAVLINKIIAVIIAQYTFNNLLNIKVKTTEFINAVKNPWIASIVGFLIGYFIYEQLGFNFYISLIIQFVSYCFSIWLLMGHELKVQVKQLKLARQK
ncbi:lipopolysaccharide biosynthesis protein [Olivibacter sp. SDN3]|uniref:lipopolysaccharide biosynthesis protein n=1 Tax=Olivibacter sp. SDN3 TaxID=2764720 RepID=UPI0016513B94|nr:lipopolysaccharide biosynthesis protein [Olivibacter sp. SDN3]QNL51624.1 lipopolysaccharide biosynthesis protein [Olivibacter sp. SDN3]